MGTKLPKNKLTDRMLKSRLAAGRYYDDGGAGLHILVRKSGSKSWVQRIRLHGKYADIGLGGYPSIPLSKARKIAMENKALAIEGKDPRLVRAKPKQAPKFSEIAKKVVAVKAKQLSNEKHKAQWASTLETYAYPILGDMPIDQIEVEQVLNVLEPIWDLKQETASRVRGRIEAVLDYAIARKYRSPPNPAAWKSNLAALLPAKVKGKATQHHPALSIEDAPRWWSRLSERDGIGTKALQFLTLTACRSGEVRGMKWSEIQSTKSGKCQHVWVIPASRMKARREHRVPLSEDMEELLKTLPRHKGSDLVFHSSSGKALSDMTLSATMKRLHEADLKAGGAGFIDLTSKRPAVPHGLRSTFRDWAAESGYDGDMAEIQLAHEVGTRVTQAYLRSDMIEKRMDMMMDWAAFLQEQ